jgi:hypothetical protein
MHPDIAYQLTDQRHAELVAAVAHQRLVDEAKPSRAPDSPADASSLAVGGGYLA